MTPDTPPDAPPPQDDIDRLIRFLQGAGALKDTLRSGFTPAGRPESTAEHSWRLCLLALLLEDRLEGADLLHLLKLCIVHDLGEAISGDVPAPLQTAGSDRRDRERRDMAELCAPLPAATAARLMALWDEAAAGRTPEARLAKGLDRIETILTHAQGTNPPDFDYGFNLGYGRDRTGATPLLGALREAADAATRARMDGA
ncbi:HD domain-containing protein [Mangrovicoccus algicola]|uniref:5'-deoxynucleotidase n=1 Tax=Mangrovicoccus algicola TaxID=2771008 RepID=A0A8J6YVB4_9RHOB|nr:HD domain-containing protein [Mangrovicoccus algicola]MBE3638302.1 HD domain-containing protein [Mangrovicoccus algicola]